MNELEEATRAVALGGNVFKDKWGTPDVIGKYEPKPSDIIKGTTEIISAELKLDMTQLITAFGQICSYKLFSDLDSLCLIFEIGLVVFDVNSPAIPDFQIHARAGRHQPDLFYTNKYMKLIEYQLFS